MNLTIILFGDNGYNTLGALRSLRMHNIDVFLLLVSKKRINYILSSKFIQQYQIVKNEQEGINFLLKNLPEVKTVILPTSDRSVSLLDKNYNKLQYHYIFPNVGQQDCLNEWMDKEKMITNAFQSGINVPFTFRYKKFKELPVMYMITFLLIISYMLVAIVVDNRLGELDWTNYKLFGIMHNKQSATYSGDNKPL